MNRLKELRENFGETQEELGIFLNVTKATISKYEKGIVDISNHMLIKLSEHYSCSTDYILGITPFKKDDDNSHIKSIYLLKKLGISDQELSQESINKIAEYIEFIKQQEKGKEK